ncbi:MAG: radical SAM protein [Gammaproteobacteria bacterium]|nr:radical SAM protein [Gammaproteobacteria bacterium]
MIVDAHGRRFRNLRISLTAACNYACTYCVPDGKRLQAAQAELSADEMGYAVRLLIEAAGIEKVRITGGEPLLSPKFDTLLPVIMQLPLDDVSITTNGQLVPRKSALIINAGVRRINVSLDTLDADRFRLIARSGDLATVLLGIEQLLAAGIKVKINMVPMRTENVDQILPMLDYCFERGIELRFIELMNMGHLKVSNQYAQDFFGMDEILERIGERHEFTRTDAPYDSTAVRYEVPDQGFFGIIANESEPFCSSCTRLRLSSNGRLYGCLSSATSYDMREVLTLPKHQALARLQRLLVLSLAEKQSVSFKGEVTVMKFIGG